MYQVIIVVHVLLGLGVIGLILMQQGKGADAGAAFGSGSSGSVFGAQGAASFLSRTTAILATLFFITSLTLAIFNSHQGKKADLMDTVESEQKTVDVPLADKPAAVVATDTPSVVNNNSATPAVAVTATPVASEKAVVTENQEAKPAVENKAAEGSKSEKPVDDTAEKKKDEAVEHKADNKKAEKKHESDKKSSDKHAKKHQSDADKKDKK